MFDSRDNESLATRALISSILESEFLESAASSGADFSTSDNLTESCSCLVTMTCSCSSTDLLKSLFLEVAKSAAVETSAVSLLSWASCIKVFSTLSSSVARCCRINPTSTSRTCRQDRTCHESVDIERLATRCPDSAVGVFVLCADATGGRRVPRLLFDSALSAWTLLLFPILRFMVEQPRLELLDALGQGLNAVVRR